MNVFFLLKYSYLFIQLDIIVKRYAEKDIYCSIIYNDENVEIT